MGTFDTQLKFLSDPNFVSPPRVEGHLPAFAEAVNPSPRGTKLLRPRQKDRRTSSVKRNLEKIVQKRREHEKKRTKKCSITACDKSVSPERAKVGSVLCSFHKLWEHAYCAYCVPESACNASSNKQCDHDYDYVSVARKLLKKRLGNTFSPISG